MPLQTRTITARRLKRVDPLPASVNEHMDLTSSYGTTLDLDERPADILEILAMLVPSIEITMASLYDLQVALNEINGRRYTRRFADIRTSIKAQWEIMIQILRQTHAFATDVAYLRRHMRKSTLTDVQEALDDMSAEAVKLKAASSLLSQEHLESLSSYIEHFKVLKHHLRAQDFLESSRPYEDPNAKRVGKRALKELNCGLEGIQTALDLQSKFWSDQVVACQACRQALVQGFEPQDKAWMVQLTSEWKQYESGVEKAIHSITKVSDALTISATRAGKRNVRGTSHPGNERGDGTLFSLAAVFFVVILMALLGYFQGIW